MLRQLIAGRGGEQMIADRRTWFVVVLCTWLSAAGAPGVARAADDVAAGPSCGLAAGPQAEPLPLAEAPEHREPAATTPAPAETADDVPDTEMSVDDFQESIAEGLSAVGQLLKSEPAQRVRKALEHLPRSKRYRNG